MGQVIELWKDIEGFEEFYQVSNSGKIKSLSRYVQNGSGGSFYTSEKIINPYVNKNGYSIITLSKNNKDSKRYVHRLVGIAFIQNPDNKPCINHKDGDKTNNNDWNLEWTTYAENNLHAYRNLPHSNAKKVINTITGEEFATVSEAFEKNEINYSKGHFADMLSGRKTNFTTFKYMI